MTKVEVDASAYTEMYPVADVTTKEQFLANLANFPTLYSQEQWDRDCISLDASLVQEFLEAEAKFREVNRRVITAINEAKAEKLPKTEAEPQAPKRQQANAKRRLAKYCTTEPRS